MSKKKTKKSDRKRRDVWRARKARGVKDRGGRGDLYLHIAICVMILAVTLLTYINTLDYPFQFDDLHRIVGNSSIRSFEALREEYDFLKGERSVVNFTLMMNYSMGAKDAGGSPTPEGMRLFNIIFHAFNAVLVYFFALVIFKAMLVNRQEKKREDPTAGSAFMRYVRQRSAAFLAGFGALIFSLHPVQTESVTYIITRSEILGTFFCLIGVLLYIRLMPSRSMVHFVLIIAGVVATYALAMESKEWAPVLPLLLLLVDYVFLSGGNGKRFVKRFAETSTLIFFMLMVAGIYLYNLKTSYKGDIDAGFSVTEMTHGQYFLSQFNVLAYYVKLFFVPTNLRLDYDFPVVSSLLEFPTYLTLPFVVLLLGLGIFTVRRSPVLSFAILWFYIAVAPSAGVIPIADLIFEHRLYFPMVGFGIFAAYLVWRVFQLEGLRRFECGAYLLLAVLVTCYTVGTVKRNRAWSSIEALWKDSAEKSPGKARPQANLGFRYLEMYQEGLKGPAVLDDAEAHLARAVELKPNHDVAYLNLGLVHQAKAEGGFSPAENLEKAREAYRESIELTNEIISNLEKRIRTKGKYDKALRKTLEKNAEFYHKRAATAYHNLAVSYEHDQNGNRYGVGFDLDRAIEAWNKSLEHKPGNPERMWNRAIAFVNGGATEKGAEGLRAWMEETGEKGVANTFYTNGFAAAAKNDHRRARYYLETGLNLAPEHPKAGPAREYIRNMERGGAGRLPM